MNIQSGSNMTGTDCDLLTHKSSRSYLNHLVHCSIMKRKECESSVYACSYLTVCVTFQGFCFLYFVERVGLLAFPIMYALVVQLPYTFIGTVLSRFNLQYE